MLIAAMDTTIMNTTMPIIAKSLGGFSLFAWAFASYMITTTVFSPIAGRLSDLYGRKRIFAFGIVLFLIGSLLCGISETMVQLVLYRALQGIGAGFMMPFPAIIAGDLFSVENRGKIQAFTTGMWGLSSILAPLFGAVFVEYLSWRWIFYINIPISILSLVTLIPYREEYSPKRTQIDYLGAILFTLGVSTFLLVTIVHSFQIIFAILGALLLIGFYFFEKQQKSPLVPLSMFQIKSFRWMNINNFFAWTALFGATSYIPLFLQKITHLSIFTSGLALLGTAISWMAASVPTGKWILRYGYRNLFIIGNCTLVISGILLALLHEENGFWYVFFVMLVYGFSFGLLSTTGVIGAQQLVDPHQRGISTSFIMFIRNIGTAIGITIMGSLMTSANTVMGGIHHLFIFGFIGSLFAFVTSFFIKEPSAKLATSK